MGEWATHAVAEYRTGTPERTLGTAVANMPGFVIDIVIPHVDGSAPGYEALCREHGVDWIPCQVRELGLLRFVLRSIEASAPWVREVTIAVQDEGHLPAWLARDQLRVSRHEEFIPVEHLPTFQSAVISAHLHRIPGLAERFVIWEDDTFAGAPLAPGSFFAADGLPRTDPLVAPIIPGLERWLGGYQWTLAWSRLLIRRQVQRRLPLAHLRRACFLFPHMPVAVHRDTWRRMFEELSQDAWFLDTVTRPSGGDHQAQPTIDPLVVHANWIDLVERRRFSAGRLLEYAAHWMARARARLRGPWGHPPRWGDFSLVNDAARFQKRMGALAARQPEFFNINDNAYDSYRDDKGQWLPGDAPPNPHCLEAVLRTLQDLFPRPSRFERTDG